jgi:hypothetical protein
MPDRLWRIFAELSEAYPKISLQGMGAACAIQLEHKGRMATVSDIKGGWWVEFGETPTRLVRDGLFHAKDEVLRVIREWLNRKV